MFDVITNRLETTPPHPEGSRAEAAASRRGGPKGEVLVAHHKGAGVTPRDRDGRFAPPQGEAFFRQQSPKLAAPSFGVIVRLGQDRDVRAEVARVLHRLRPRRGQDDFQAGPLPGAAIAPRPKPFQGLPGIVDVGEHDIDPDARFPGRGTASSALPASTRSKPQSRR